MAGVRRRILAHVEWRLRSGWFARVVREAVARHPLVFGPPERISVAASADVSGALLNVMSGRIEVGEHSFVGHNVSLLTGTHDHRLRGRDRYLAVPPDGRDIVIGEGVWLASNCTVLGPCRIGDHAVVAAGALVTRDVPSGSIVAGVPARVVPSG